MSKLYIPALALALVGGGASAQHSRTATAQEGRALNKVHTDIDNALWRPSQPTVQWGERAAFWSEDFSGGAIPAGWTNEDLLTPVPVTPDDPPIVTFVWTDDPAAVEPAALNYAPSEIFNAPGAADGYIWCNSDRGLPLPGPATDHLTTLTTTAIDCSGQPTVQLSMQSLIGVFDYDANTNVKVKVSTNGVDWTDFFPFPCLETGVTNPPCVRWSANPETVGVNISSVAANQPTVYLQFEWQGKWDYFWAIDDIELSPLPPNEIELNNAYTSQTGTGEEYGRVPLSQARPTINIGAELYNYGGENQTNVTVTATTTGGSPSTVTATETVALIEPDSTFFFDTDAPIVAEIGQYTVDFTMTSDQIALDLDTTNNRRSRHFSYTNDVYSLDAIGLHPEGTESLTQVGTSSFLDNAENVKLMNYYEIYNTWTVTGVEIALGSATRIGSSIIVSILDTVDVLATPSVTNEFLVQSEIHEITAGDSIAGVVGIAFDQPYELTPNAYYVVASCFAGSDGVNPLHVYIQDDATVPQPGLASALWLPFDPPDNINFYGNGTAWAIRLSSNPTIGVQEVAELEGVSMYPNPTTGILNINTTTNEKYTVEVMNMLGELIMTTKFTGMTTMDLANFADGVYSVRISNGTSATVQRVTLN